MIDSLDVEFPEGLIIISGQTGAGKSILLGALSLLLGAKADASVIGGDASNCVVEAVFEIPGSDRTLLALLEENGVEAAEGELIIRRVVGRTGRSRSFINDSPVNVQTLQAISSRLVDIHSQHQTLLLSDKTFQLSMLDHFAGNQDLLSECSLSYRHFKTLEKEYSEVCGKLDGLNEEKEYIAARYKRLEDAKLVDGEVETLEAEQKKLENAEEIKSALTGVEEMFSPSDPDSEILPLSSALKEAQKSLERLSRFIPESESLARRVESARTELDDILDEVSSLNSRIEVSKERLDAVDDRLSTLYDLLRDYSASSVADLIAKRDALSESLFDSTALQNRKAELENQLSDAKENLEGVCKSLHEARAAACGPFAKAITDAVRALEMEYAVFKVELTPGKVSATGSDGVDFLFSASGTDPKEVGRCASGGEMSRLMLCLKAMMARFVNMPTLIFDEIDTGVSGSVADKIGKTICGMGHDMQVFAITHLPQVAAKGDAHYVVEKEFDVLGKASTTIRQVSGQERVMEIARMLSGSDILPEAVENAKALLSR